MLYRRLVGSRPHWTLFSVLMLVELVLGFTGHFADFKTTLMLGALAVTERFDVRRLASWIAISVLAIGIFLSGLIWTGIKSQYRAELRTTLMDASLVERASRVGVLVDEWGHRESAAALKDFDEMVDRVWAVYYPAMALARVPEHEPHTNGKFLSAAIMHVLRPRLLFPDKAPVMHDSDKVRRYAGISVAGLEKNVSIAFGYVIESYIDFGVPLMFLPIFLWGCFMGWAYRASLVWSRNRELSIAITCVIFWKSLYLFEKSWDKMVGESVTLILFLLVAVKCYDLFFAPPANQTATCRE
jgi:hypothetical protein